MLGLLAYLGFVFSHALWVPAMVARIDECEPCAGLGEMRFLAAYFLVVSFLPSIYFYWQVHRHRRAGQIPRPEAWVMFRTRVWTGAWYQCQLIMMGLGGLVTLAFPAFLLTEFPYWAVFFDSGC